MLTKRRPGWASPERRATPEAAFDDGYAEQVAHLYTDRQGERLFA